MNEALLLLVLGWAALVVPRAVRSRNASPHATVGGFERAMDVLRSDARGSSGSRRVFVPGDAGRIVERESATSSRVEPVRVRSEDPVVARRRSWFVRTVAATVVTLLLALIGGGGWLWLPFLISAPLTGGYVAVLRHLKLQRDEARRVVRELELHRGPATTVDQDLAVGAESGAAGREPAGWGYSSTVRLRRWDD